MNLKKNPLLYKNLLNGNLDPFFLCTLSNEVKIISITIIESF